MISLHRRRSSAALLAAAVLLSVALSVVTSFASAQTGGSRKLNVKDRVQLELPVSWTINDAEQRKSVRELTEKMTGSSVPYTASLVAQSHPAPSRVFVRVSFIPMEPPVSQAELLRELKADQQGVLRAISQSWADEAPAMWAALAKNGIRQVGREAFTVEPFGGQTAMVVRYGRTSTTNPAETMKVAQYHVVLGHEKALVTLSYIDGDRAATADQERIKASFVIR